MSHAVTASRQGITSTLIGILFNAILAITKGTAGILGNSYALVADAIESTSDIFSSLVVLVGLRMAGKPADENHPYGHGKFEPLATAVVAILLLAAALLIAVESVREIMTPHHAPKAFTLWVLIVVVVVKEGLYRFVGGVGHEVGSSAVQADAWHHRSDAVTSFAAFLGISIALLGGEGYESADDFAALVAAGVITLNAGIFLRKALYELVDTAPHPILAQQIREIAHAVPGVLGTHKCHVRKVGFDHFVDLDVLCDPDKSIRHGHEVAHDVGEAIHARLPEITKILVHVEPADDYGRRMR